MSDFDLASSAVDPLYVQARRVLLDVLFALAPHRQAVIVAGAQAVYLRTGDAHFAIAPYTTDGDLALNPSLLSDDPALEQAMTDAGFTLKLQPSGHVEPGVWVAPAEIAGQMQSIPVDLIVPEGAYSGSGRRAARLVGHSNQAARRVVGLEPALIDHAPIEIKALDGDDSRSMEAEVAGVAALMIAKACKIHDRTANTRKNRLHDNDAADVLRLMQTTHAPEVAATLDKLSSDPMAGPTTLAGREYLDGLFGRRGSPGIEMASRNLGTGIDLQTIEAICTAYMAQIRSST